MKKVIVGAALFLGLLVGRAEANPGFGYVCDVWYQPNASYQAAGNNGFGYVSLYSGPSCTGSYWGAAWICTVGATSSSCNTSYLYTEAGILALVHDLRATAQANTRVYIQWDGSSRFMWAGYYAAGY